MATDRAKALDTQRRWRERHRDAERIRGRIKYYKSIGLSPEEAQELGRQRHTLKGAWTPDDKLEYVRSYRARVRAKVVALYGSRCACCGETNPALLTFDHINNDGKKDRNRYRAIGASFYNSLLREKRADVQLLCWNCNCVKMHYAPGSCRPHPLRPITEHWYFQEKASCVV